MVRRFSRWAVLGIVAVAPALGGADGGGCTPIPPGSGGTGGAVGQCRADQDCPVLAICKLCPDGSCANPNVHCQNGTCTPPNYTCNSTVACASSASCPAGQHCTTEDGACNRPPGCGPTDICPAICYGVCTSVTNPCAGKACGSPCVGPFGSPLPTYCDAAGQCLPLAEPPVCPPPDCSAEQQALVDFIQKNKACTSAADCEIRVVGCGVTEDGCVGSVYVNQSTDDALFSALSAKYTSCASGGTGCVTCKRLSRPPACISGLCQVSPG